MHTHLNAYGEPCNCTFYRPPYDQAEQDWKLGAKEKVEWPKTKWVSERPDVQKNPELQKFVAAVVASFGGNNVGEKLDPLVPWMLREFKKGRLSLAGPNDNYVWHDGGPLTGYDLSHLADWYHSDAPNRKGTDIMQLTIDEALKEKVPEWDQHMKEQQELADQKNAEGGEVVHKFDDGWTVRKLTDQKELKYEGDAMGHCCGTHGYPQRVQDGSVQIHSLRGPDHKPHVTMETHPDIYRGGMVCPKCNSDDIATEEGPAYEAQCRDCKHADHEENFIGDPFHNSGIAQIQGRFNEVPEPHLQARMKEWLSTIPEHKRPEWEEGPRPIEEMADFDRDHTEDAYGRNMGGYGPHGDYGLRTPLPPIDYSWVLNNLDQDSRGRHSGEWQNIDEDDIKRLYQEALKRKEIPELGKEMESFGEDAQNELMEHEEQNYDNLIPYAGEPGEESDFEYPYDHFGYEFQTPQEHQEAYREERDDLYRSHPGSQITDALHKHLNPHYDKATESYVNKPMQTFSRWVFGSDSPEPEGQPVQVVEGPYSPHNEYEKYQDKTRHAILWDKNTNRVHIGPLGSTHAGIFKALHGDETYDWKNYAFGQFCPEHQFRPQWLGPFPEGPEAPDEVIKATEEHFGPNVPWDEDGQFRISNYDMQREIDGWHDPKYRDMDHPDIQWVPTDHLKELQEWDRTPGAEHAYTSPERWDALKNSIATHGFSAPSWVDYNPDTQMGHLSEGNHRLGIAKQLGITAMPVRVIRSRRNSGGNSRHYPDGPQGYDAHQMMKPSDIGMPITHPWEPKTSATRENKTPWIFDPHTEQVFVGPPGAHHMDMDCPQPDHAHRGHATDDGEVTSYDPSTSQEVLQGIREHLGLPEPEFKISAQAIKDLPVPVEHHDHKDGHELDATHGSSHPVIWDGETLHMGPLGGYHAFTQWGVNPYSGLSGRYYPAGLWPGDRSFAWNNDPPEWDKSDEFKISAHDSLEKFGINIFHADPSLIHEPVGFAQPIIFTKADKGKTQNLYIGEKGGYHSTLYGQFPELEHTTKGEDAWHGTLDQNHDFKDAIQWYDHPGEKTNNRIKNALGLKVRADNWITDEDWQLGDSIKDPVTDLRII